MQSLKWLLLCVLSGLAGIWLIGLVALCVEKMSQRKQSKFNKWFKSLTKELQKKYWVLPIAIICNGCCQHTAVQIKPTCPPMLREATYRAMQADEIADYRIAVEKCKL